MRDNLEEEKKRVLKRKDNKRKKAKSDNRDITKKNS